MRQKEKMQTVLYKMVHGGKKGFWVHIALAVLRLFAFVYGQGVRFTLALYQYGLLKPHKLDCHVISLGNITVGGTGKTPTAQRLAAIIRDLGYRVVVLNRGYRAGYKGRIGLVSDGRKIYMSVTEAGDEAFLLAQSLPGVPVVIGVDRTITGKYAVEKLGAQVVILDDGYQHWRLARDLDIVLIDSINAFGNGYTLPRGMLREPLSHLDRADICLMTKVDQSTAALKTMIKETVARYNERALIVESAHSPRYFVEIADCYKGGTGVKLDLAIVKDQPVIAFSAIGNPLSFENNITGIGARVLEGVRFPDHHDYTMAEIQQVMELAVLKGAAALITTDKDAVKIPAEFIHAERPLPVYVLGIEIRFLDGYEALIDRLQKSMKQ